MSTKLLSIFLLLVGTTLTVNGMVVKADDILASANLAVGQVNIHQFETALELYYLNHNSYPDVTGGAALIDELKREDYIRENRLVNVDDFNYQVKEDGQDYSLELKFN